MRQLSEDDALFLASESAHASANVSLVQIYDRRRPGGKLRSRASSRWWRAGCTVRRSSARSCVRCRSARRAVLDRDENSSRVPRAQHRAPKPVTAPVLHPASRITRARSTATAALGDLRHRGAGQPPRPPARHFALLTKLHHAAIDVERAPRSSRCCTQHAGSPEAEPPTWFPESPRACSSSSAAVSRTRRCRPRGCSARSAT